MKTVIRALQLAARTLSTTARQKLPEEKAKRELLLGGEELGERRGEKKLVALTRCTIKFEKEEDLFKCAEALRVSDEALRARPNERKLWDWQLAVRDGMKIHFGVAWYNMGFFSERKGAYKDANHIRQYNKFNSKIEDFEVQHFVAEKESPTPSPSHKLT